MDTPKTCARSYASFNEGLYLFFSRKTMVSRLTFTFFASSSWVRLNLALNSLIRLVICQTFEVNDQPGNCKCESHSQDTGSYQFLRIHDDSVFNEKQKYPEI